MTALAIISARWGSRRFPGKVLELLAGVPVLEHVVKRTAAAGVDVVVAIPHGDRDARIWDFCRNKLRVPCFMHGGFENDVLGSFLKAVVFGLEVGLISTYRGYTCAPTSAGVSRSTTSTVVTASVCILISDYFITALWGV